MSDTQPPMWEVTHQEDEPDYDAAGNRTSKMRVHFQTASGVQSHVVVPAHEYTAKNVAAAIHEKASKIESVSQLNSTTQPE